jgi:hypothetical protein
VQRVRVRFVLLIEAGAPPKIHRSLGRDTPAQIYSENPTAISNQTSPDGTKQMILYQSLRGKSPSGPAWCRYQTIASPTGFSVLITTSGGTGYHSPSMGTQY